MATFAQNLPEPPASARSAVGDHATAEDSLGFSSYVEAVAAFLTSKETRPPLTMSIEGEWGSGKSSFMLQLEKVITGPSRREAFLSAAPPAWGGQAREGSLFEALKKAWEVRRPPVIRFNAWRHDKQDALWAAFALAVSKRLRQRIGFWRGLWADLCLLLSRLDGLRGWLELLLAVVSVGMLLLSLYALGHDVYRNGLGHFSGVVKHLLGEKEVPSIYGRSLASEAAFHGSWLGALLLACAGLVKFQEQVKLPIAIDLKKYLATPDYKGHSAFIESFHEDFARLVRAYARQDRVFVFIDDLDRCDVPRAAELMQAINLMISDAGNLVFILGMDREKVAAGLTQKYKDLLPYLPEYTSGLVSNNPVIFGYGYLEKFIQLTFTLPVMAGEDALEKFLNALVPSPARPPWRKAVSTYWTDRLRAMWVRDRTDTAFEEFTDPELLQSATRVPNPFGAMRAERRVARLRLRIAQDSAVVHEAVRMASPLFGNNPRRLKQFLSTYRLALALTDSQGILTAEPHRDGVTMQQLAKFVALTMKFPDLRAALAAKPTLLADLEEAEPGFQASDLETSPHLRWLQSSLVRDVLKYGVSHHPEPLPSAWVPWA